MFVYTWCAFQQPWYPFKGSLKSLNQKIDSKKCTTTVSLPVVRSCLINFQPCLIDGQVYAYLFNWIANLSVQSQAETKQERVVGHDVHPCCNCCAGNKQCLAPFLIGLHRTGLIASIEGDVSRSGAPDLWQIVAKHQICQGAAAFSSQKQIHKRPGYNQQHGTNHRAICQSETEAKGCQGRVAKGDIEDHTELPPSYALIVVPGSKDEPRDAPKKCCAEHKKNIRPEDIGPAAVSCVYPLVPISLHQNRLIA
mmetsp:Transcript_85755/g.136193  ORF Transcript_85755/g.136193 Transcript_85755/m.136193 type:complete len:252 (-) Transcript_85755:662-1417(-)